MKKIIYILALLFTAVSLSRCGKYLDVDPYFKDMVNVDSVFTNKNYTEQWLNDVYAYFGWYGGIEIAFADVTGFNLASDDAMFSNAGSLCENYQNAQFSPTNELNDGRWGTLYQGIRQASILIIIRQVSRTGWKYPGGLPGTSPFPACLFLLDADQTIRTRGIVAGGRGGCKSGL